MSEPRGQAVRATARDGERGEPSLALRSASVSEAGPRPTNEDAVVQEPALGLFAVCDGMGGHAAGEVAARAVGQALVEHVRAHGVGEGSGDSALAVLYAAVLRGADALDLAAARDPSAQGLGTTCTALWVVGARAFVAHIGDSRLYCLRDARVHAKTRDHSFVAEAVRAGLLTEDEARTSTHRSLLTRALGSGDPSPDLASFEIRAGDRWLLCSDGVHGPIAPHALAACLGAGTDPELVARALVDTALAAGGHDNASAVVIFADPLASHEGTAT
jgi:protein phosphatase